MFFLKRINSREKYVKKLISSKRVDKAYELFYPNVTVGTKLESEVLTFRHQACWAILNATLSFFTQKKKFKFI